MEKLSEILDKNIDRLVEAIGKLGPDAEFVFQDMVEKQALMSWVMVVLSGMVLAAVWFLSLILLWAANEELKEKNDWGGVMFAGLAILFFGTVAVGAWLAGSLGSALHPTATVVKDLIQ